mmetsp:Transcript_23550/g.59180  ORF Transcript_23550/g.59180 Transcript_23550/m.59180 type:complete len:241 (-) Transcript_23550:548-1270(-)
MLPVRSSEAVGGAKLARGHQHARRIGQLGEHQLRVLQRLLPRHAKQPVRFLVRDLHEVCLGHVLLNHGLGSGVVVEEHGAPVDVDEHRRAGRLGPGHYLLHCLPRHWVRQAQCARHHHHRVVDELHGQLGGVNEAVRIRVGGRAEPRKVAVPIDGPLHVHVPRGLLHALHARQVDAALLQQGHELVAELVLAERSEEGALHAQLGKRGGHVGGRAAGEGRPALHIGPQLAHLVVRRETIE